MAICATIASSGQFRLHGLTSLLEDIMNRFKKTFALSILGASAFALMAQGASAADFPKSGSDKGVIYFTAATAEELEGWETPFQPGLYVMTGVTRTDPEGGPFDKIYSRCVGVRALLDGKYASNGTCTGYATDGDKLFLTFEVGKFNLVGGTGKFKGITGVGTVKADRIYQGKNDWAIIMAFEKNWEIK
jgi:hypothetical protein